MIKQEIPKGWKATLLTMKDLPYTGIPYKTIITDWRWQNRHANPVETTIIPVEYAEKETLFLNYNAKL